MNTASIWICRVFALAMIAVCCGCQSEPEYAIVEAVNPNTGKIDRYYKSVGGVEGDPQAWATNQTTKYNGPMPPPGKRVVYRK